MKKYFLFVTLIFIAFYSCKSEQKKNNEEMASAQISQEADTVQTALGPLVLPKPFATKSVNNRNGMKDWPEGKVPTAPEGFTVTKFADGFKNPRWTYIAPNGDMFVCEANTRGSAGLITLLRDKDGDGAAEIRETFLEDLKQPFGMLVIGNSFYLANTDGLYKYPYKEGQTSLKGSKGKKIVEIETK